MDKQKRVLVLEYHGVVQGVFNDLKALKNHIRRTEGDSVADFVERQLKGQGTGELLVVTFRFKADGAIAVARGWDLIV